MGFGTFLLSLLAGFGAVMVLGLNEFLRARVCHLLFRWEYALWRKYGEHGGWRPARVQIVQDGRAFVSDGFCVHFVDDLGDDITPFLTRRKAKVAA
jgi:hypothetical protein